jgi:DNA-binding NarL/FixJ family response regulator
VNAYRILLADDHALIRAAMRLLVGQVDGTLVVGEASDGREATAQALALRPDLVIMDISMPGLNGIEATSQIRAKVPGTRVLILSSHATEDHVSRALKAGASGYLVKDAIPQELTAAITCMRRGEVYLSPGASQQLVARIARGDREGSPLEALTARQREVLQMVAEGRTTKQMAHTLAISVKTIETHRAEIMRRLGIHDVAGLALFAAYHGLVASDPPGSGDR